MVRGANRAMEKDLPVVTDKVDSLETVETICDVDGVVADMVPYLFELLRRDGFEIADISDPMWHRWNFFQDMSRDARESAYEIMADSAFWYDLPVVEGAKDGIATMREAGHHIQWVTTPWTSCIGWSDARREWLNHNFGCDQQDIARDLTITGNKSNIMADIFIDDKVSNVREWAARNDGLALLFKTNFNREAHEEMATVTWSHGQVVNRGN